jgi:hypothetical protein
MVLLRLEWSFENARKAVPVAGSGTLKIARKSGIVGRPVPIAAIPSRAFFLLDERL